MDYQSALDFLDGLKENGIRPGLDRVKSLLKLSSFKYKGEVIHIAGTNGKGSCAVTLDNILRSAGFKTGLYTSPELIDFRERFKINGGIISKDDFSKFAEIIKNNIDKLHDKPTFFEATTVLALLYFMENNVDFMILEVGLGGRLDATNILDSKTCAVTTIGLDHMQYLGDTIEDIGREKAGIIKTGSTCFSGCSEESMEILRKISLEKQGKLIDVKKMISDISTSLSGTYFSFKTDTNQYQLESKLIGEHQAINISCAVGIAEHLGIGKYIILDGVSKTKWAGRLEILQESPMVLIDCAHNPDAVEKLMNFLGNITYNNLIVVCGFSFDKDIGTMLDSLSIADILVATHSSDERALDPKFIVEQSSVNKKFYFENIGKAIEFSISEASENDLILVCGSIFLIGETINYWRNKK